MRPLCNGTFEVVIENVAVGTDYYFLLDGMIERPDPASRCQPFGVHGPSRVVNPAMFVWTDHEWPGRAPADYIIYELHVGAFTPERTFDGVIARLGHLGCLGVTAVEIMPIAAFAGERNWGYDGVSLYAPHAAYGGPAGFARLVNACHAAGLAVVLDVVYNHVGPEGNYLSEFGPYFSRRHRTPWGDAFNFDGPGSDNVRRFIVENALSWLVDFHVDALRLDAVHRMHDRSATHVLQEIAMAFHAEARRLGRQASLFPESDLNDEMILSPPEDGGYGLEAQWSDDFHHALFARLVPHRQGVLGDFGAMRDIQKALVTGFVYDGRWSEYRKRVYGKPSRGRPGSQFIVFTQNHDQVANVSGGRRLATVATFEQQKLAAVVLLTTPNVPLLFMGQEYGETRPFLYFTSHEDATVAKAVWRGRRAEYASYMVSDDCPNPQALETFLHSTLEWACLDDVPHRFIFDLHRELLALRRRTRCLSNCRMDLTTVAVSEDPPWLVVERNDPDGTAAFIACNFSTQPVSLPPLDTTRPWRRVLWTGDAHYGGTSQDAEPPRVLRWEAGAFAAPLAPWNAAIYLADPPEADRDVTSSPSAGANGRRDASRAAREREERDE
jgi:maltooligosyltrehalose trehalohydrolase